MVLLSVKVVVGNHLGRSELERLSFERQARKKARKESRARKTLGRGSTIRQFER
jgi:hypothetical protein